MTDKEILQTARAMLNSPQKNYEYLKDLIPFKLRNHQEYGILFNVLIFSLIKSQGPDKDTISKIKNILEKEFEANGPSYWYYEHLAHIYFYENNPLSFLYYAKASSKSLGFSVFHLTHGINTIIDFPDNKYKQLNLDEKMHYGEKSPIPTLPNMEQIRQKAKGKRQVHIISCDSTYFEKHFLTFLNSYEDNNFTETLIYLTIINPTSKQQEDISNYNKKENIQIEAIDYNLNDYNDSWKKSLYACARFFSIPATIEATQLPVVVTDIDIMVTEKIYNPLDLLQESDVGVCGGISSFKHYYPWTKVSAGLLVLSGSEMSLNFSLILRDYILSAFNFNPASSNWGVDQTALYFSVKSMEKDFDNFKWEKLRLSMATKDQKGRY